MWRKSSRSGGNGGECVQVAQAGAIRGSKNPDPVLLIGLGEFLSVVKSGRLDRP